MGWCGYDEGFVIVSFPLSYEHRNERGKKNIACIWYSAVHIFFVQ